MSLMSVPRLHRQRRRAPNLRSVVKLLTARQWPPRLRLTHSEIETSCGESDESRANSGTGADSPRPPASAATAGVAYQGVHLARLGE